MTDKNEFMIIAGEASGDLHGGALVSQLSKLIPDALFFGIGGHDMEAAGVDLGYHVRDLGVTGFTEVLGKLPVVIKAMRWAIAEARRRHPKAAILIDYPDFNLRLAKKLSGITPVIYYVSPQLWAWRPGRVNIIARHVTKMLVLFPFEADWYRERGVDAVYVGNPVVDRLANTPSREHCRQILQIDDNIPMLALLPGSRPNEIQRIFPIFIDAVKRLRQSLPNLMCFVPVATTLTKSMIEQMIPTGMEAVHAVDQNAPVVLKAADFAWVTSGTATLETALAQTPMIIVYKTSFISYHLAKYLVRIPFIGMANLVAGEEVARELIQGDAVPETLVHATLPLLTDPQKLLKQKQRLDIVRRNLDHGGASARAAQAVLAACGITPRKSDS